MHNNKLQLHLVSRLEALLTFLKIKIDDILERFLLRQFQMLHMDGMIHLL